jgi:hypothetical protein
MPLDRVGCFEKFARHGSGLFPHVYQTAYRRSLSDSIGNTNPRLATPTTTRSALQLTESVAPAPQQGTPQFLVGECDVQSYTER